MKTTEENNRIIDLFIAEFEPFESDRLNIINDLTVKGFPPQRYDEDWNLLMPVVQICKDSCHGEGQHLIDKIDEALLQVDMTAVVMACVAFIQWYNTQESMKK